MKLKPTMNAFPIRETRKIKFLRMKLTLLFLVCMVGGYSQVKINLNCENRKVSEVFNDIRKQSGFIVIYESSDMNPGMKVSLKLKDAGIHEVMKAILQGTDLTYTISEDYIAISKKDAASDKSEKFVNISGRVTDKDGNPLPGATVLIKGTLQGTTTNADGCYAIKIPRTSVLVFSFIGFQKREITVSAEDTEINVVMQEAATELGEVAVISTGYQLIKPEQSTGSVATMRAKEYDSRINTTDFLTSLENRIPGLLINNNIEFEENSLFQIRGISTINGDKNPLIVIDGFPTELSLDAINPNEIESVTVLKDAAAATVYGARSSNGVIIIERKKAKAGKVNVNFRATAGFTPKENYDRYRWDDNASNISVDYYQTYINKNYPYSSFIWNLFLNDISMGQQFTFPTPGMITVKKAAGIITTENAEQQLEELASYNNAKDYSRLFLRTASTRTYNLDVSGGNEKALYYITANYTASDLSEIRNDNSRFMLSGRSTINFSDRFSLDLTTDFQKTEETSVPVPDIETTYPYEAFEDEDGNPLSLYNGSYVSSYYNDIIMELGLPDNMYYPLVDINEVSDKTYTVNNRITANFRYNIGNGFNLKFGGVYENSRTDTKHLASENSSEVHQYINLYAEDDESGGFIFNIPQGGFLKQTASSTESYTLRAQLDYDKQINKNHSLNLILGGEIRNVLDKSNTASYFGYNDQTLLHQAVDYNTLKRGDYAKSNPRLYYNRLFKQEYENNRYVSAYSNIVYAYKGKYSATGSIRIDQSNLFGTNPKYHYKPLWSVGAAWNIHKENFMQDIEWVKSLKLRMAYGFNGNVAKNALPQVIAEDGYNNLHSVTISSLSLLSLANSGLRWEQTRNFNIGLDYTIFKNISGSVDYYIKKSTDILASNQIDASKGNTSAIINQASIRNSGLEFTLHADWITRKNFNWNTGLVLSHNSSKVLQVYYDETELNSGWTYVKCPYVSYLDGYAVGAMFSYRYAGLDSNGSILIYDENNEAEEFSYDITKEDILYSGTSIPTCNIGLSNRVDIGNFYVYCMFNFYGGFKVRVPVPDPSAVRPLEGAGNYWKEAGDEADPDMLPSPFYYYADELGYTDKYVVSGAYLTLGDLTASYSFRDSKWLKKTGIKNFEVKLQASNLFTVGFNKYNYSVATGSYAKSYLTPTYTIGLYVNF